MTSTDKTPSWEWVTRGMKKEMSSLEEKLLLSFIMIYILTKIRWRKGRRKCKKMQWKKEDEPDQLWLLLSLHSLHPLGWWLRIECIKFLTLMMRVVQSSLMFLPRNPFSNSEGMKERCDSFTSFFILTVFTWFSRSNTRQRQLKVTRETRRWIRREMSV